MLFSSRNKNARKGVFLDKLMTGKIMNKKHSAAISMKDVLMVAAKSSFCSVVLLVMIKVRITVTQKTNTITI